MVRSQENLRSISRGAVKDNNRVRVLVSMPSSPKENGADQDWMKSPYRDEQRGSIVEVDCASRKVRIIVPEDASLAPSIFRLSPSGKWVSFLSVGGLKTRALAVVPRSGGTETARVEGLPRIFPDPNLRSYRWHPKRDLLVFVKDGRLWALDFADRPSSSPPRALHPDIRDAFDDPLLFTARHLLGTEPGKNEFWLWN